MHDLTNSHTTLLFFGNKFSNIFQGLGDSKGKNEEKENGGKRKGKMTK
jgi:hypothetical protein